MRRSLYDEHVDEEQGVSYGVLVLQVQQMGVLVQVVL